MMAPGRRHVPLGTGQLLFVYAFLAFRVTTAAGIVFYFVKEFDITPISLLFGIFTAFAICLSHDVVPETAAQKLVLLNIANILNRTHALAWSISAMQALFRESPDFTKHSIVAGLAAICLFFTNKEINRLEALDRHED
ncbi:unnamed protein product [Caenorhabditis sp. 36 PRJEB53466]|nr:unnamed protein product [Caenorhabditis sp. 36 PRJEB53466]